MGDKTCFGCGNPIKLEASPTISEEGQPIGGISFQGQGSPHSNFYDPECAYEYIQIYLCDKCLSRRKSLIEHIAYIPKRVITMQERFGSATSNQHTELWNSFRESNNSKA